MHQGTSYKGVLNEFKVIGGMNLRLELVLVIMQIYIDIVFN